MAKKRRKPYIGAPKDWSRSRNPEAQLSPNWAKHYRNRTWREAAGQRESTVALEHLPPGLHFSETFPEPIAYDAVRKLLLYRGIMSHVSYTYLRQLSIDPAYTTALDQLRDASCQLYGQKTQRSFSRHRWWLLAAALVVGSLLAWWWSR